LVGLFEVEWKIPCHNILVEFLNNWNLDFEHNKIKIMMEEEQIIVDKHFLTEDFKIFHIGEKEADQAEMSNAKEALVDIVHRVPYIYNTNEGWVLKKMKLEYVNKIVAILPIIY
jgi:hypothetical protein